MMRFGWGSASINDRPSRRVQREIDWASHGTRRAGLTLCRTNRQTWLLGRKSRNFASPGFHEERYNLCRVKTNHIGRSLLIATVRHIEQGTGDAQNVARDAIQDLDPGCLLLVGIAGAVPGDMTLGDVVFGTSVYDLTISALSPDGSETFSLSGGPINKGLQAQVANLSAVLPAALKKVGDFPPVPSVNWEATDAIDDDDTKSAILATLKARYTGQDQNRAFPWFTDGSIASSDRLIKNASLVRQWKQVLRKVLAVEMEAAGTYRASRQRNRQYRFLSIRAISDVIGLARDDAWTLYACEIAAAFTLAFISTWRTPPRPDEAA